MHQHHLTRQAVLGPAPDYHSGAGHVHKTNSSLGTRPRLFCVYYFCPADPGCRAVCTRYTICEGPSYSPKRQELPDARETAFVFRRRPNTGSHSVYGVTLTRYESNVNVGALFLSKTGKKGCEITQGML